MLCFVAQTVCSRQQEFKELIKLPKVLPSDQKAK